MRRRQRQDKIRNSKFTTKMQKKLVVLFTLVLLAFVGLSVRLFLINRDNGEQYKKQILSQQEYDSITIPYKRGDIVDSKGTKLAYSEKVYNIVLDAKILLSDANYLEPTIQALVSCFGFSESEIRDFVTANPSSQYHILAKQLTYDDISAFIEMQNDTVTNPDLKGVWFEEEYKREYPYDTLACDVIGFTGKDNTGTYGLEEYYNDTLNGTNGREYGYLNDDSTLERTTKAAKDGNTLVSTIDANIQEIVEKYIKQFNDEHKDEYREGNGSSNTGVIIMNPNNGDVLAMASYPTFDLNDIANQEALIGSNKLDADGKKTGEVINSENLAAMDDDTVYSNLNALWKDFCISSTYEPGSTAKPFTVATGLDSGKLTGNETYTCNGFLEVGDYKIYCNNRYGHGTLDVKGALEQSCNVALMQIGFAIGKETFLKYNRIFNFGLKTNIDLAGEARTDSVVFDMASMGTTELATSAFGQGFNVTMIQMAAGFCSLINGGDYYEPHVVSKLQNSDGATVENIEPRILKQTISAETSDKILEYCNGVVSEGTGKSARPAGYTMGGKTGTAEKFPRKTGNYVVSFIGYAPAENPQVMIYVVVDEPNVEAQASAKYATEIVRNIMTDVLPYLNIYMTEELSEDEQAEVAAKEETTGSVDVAAGEDTDTTDGEITDDETTDDKATDDLETTEVVAPTIDSETGYAIDPTTGEYLDPDTGQPIDETSSFISGTNGSTGKVAGTTTDDNTAKDKNTSDKATNKTTTE